MPSGTLTGLDRLSEASDVEVQQIWSLADSLGAGSESGPYPDTPTNNDWLMMVYSEMEKRGLDLHAKPQICSHCQSLQPTEMVKVKGYDLLVDWPSGDLHEGLYKKQVITPHNLPGFDIPCLYNTEEFPLHVDLR